jgi:hypothetical protein
MIFAFEKEFLVKYYSIALSVLPGIAAGLGLDKQ